MNNFQPKRGLTIYTSGNRLLVLDQELGKGGEGSVWSIVDSPGFAAKFYHNGLVTSQARKLEAMCRLKSDCLLRIAAWPTTLLKVTPAGPAHGMLMPRITGYRQAHLLYTPKSRRIAFPDAQFPFILHASLNIVRAFATVHDAGQVIGDVNHGNLLISGEATVALIDCDSFQIHDGQTCFPCLVGVPTYTPPELQGQSFRDVRRTEQHDAFGLAVLLFHLLFLGRHPFAGIFRHGTADKTIEDAIREFRFAYLPDKDETEMDPPPAIPSLAEFPPDLTTLFVRAFSKVGANGGRPAAREWMGPLESLSHNLKCCTANDSHHYFKGLTSCPWCRVEAAFGRPTYGIRFAITRECDFDLAAIWLQIEAVQPDDAPQLTFTNALADHCQPDPRLRAVKNARRVNRLLSAVSILLGVIIFISGVIPVFWSTVILIACLYLMRRFWQAASACASEFIVARVNASRAFDAAMEHWIKLQNMPKAFEETKQGLRAQRDEYASLPSLRERRMCRLRSELRQKQMVRFLERHQIEDANIPGVGPGRKSLLRCYGVEDASDIDLLRLDIKGFGPMLKSALLSWRQSVEQRFVFNPNEQIDPVDLRTLDHELAQRRAGLVGSLTAGPEVLRRILSSWQAERVRAATDVTYRAKAVAQAEANLTALAHF